MAPVLLRLLLHTLPMVFMIKGFNGLGVFLSNATGANVFADTYGGHTQFLTMHGFALTILTLSISALHDIVPSAKFLHNIKRTLYLIVLPLNVSVSAIYWSLIIFFPQLILGQNPVGSTEEAIAGAAASGVIPFFIPLKYDLALHLLPAIAILADFIFFEKQFPSVWCKRVPATMGVYGLFYSSWVEFCAKQNDGWFPYPFLTEATFGARVAIYSGAVIFGSVSFNLINSLHSY